MTGTTAPSALPYRADIDGLRAVAVLAVVAYHAFPAALPGGFVGVDVFFVISGFLITSLLRDGMGSGGFSFLGFYARRVRRLFPALALVLASCLVAGWWLLVPGDYATLGRHAAASALFVANFVFWGETDYFAAASATLPLLHLWSLGIEEQFYLLWPPLLLLAHRRGVDTLRLTLVVGVLSLVANLLLVARDPSATFYLPFTRFWELLAGGVLAHGLATANVGARWRGALHRHAGAIAEGCALAGLALVVVACFALDEETPFPGWRAMLPVSGTMLLIASGPHTLVARRLLSLRPAVWIGLVSYPLYLWHWPLLSFARVHASGEVAPSIRIALLLAALALAAATYLLLERPLRFGLPRRRALALLLPAMALVAALGGGVAAMRGFESRAGEPVRRYAGYSYDFRGPSREGTCSLTGVPGEPRHFPPACIDPPSDKPLVVLWGDSHAAMLYPGLRAAAGDRIRIAQFTRSGCRPFLQAGNAICTATNADVLRRIANERPATVVMFALWNHLKFRDGEEMLRQLEPTIDALNQLGVARVVVVGPAPKWRDWLPRNLVRMYDEQPFLHVPRRTRQGLDPAAFALDALLRTRLGERDDVVYVSAIERMCDVRGCLVYMGDDPDVLTTWDYGHLTAPAARYLAEGIGARLGGWPPDDATVPGRR